jgi:hypothetical protein
MTVPESDDYMRDYRNYSWQERLKISNYLTSIAYGYHMDDPPEMDKTAFTALKRSNG